MPLHPISVPDPTVSRRFSELDAIRGLACLSVVFLHFRDMWLPVDPSVLPKRQEHVLHLLQPFYTGHQAVIMFFLLSGFVLSLPYIRGRSQPYPTYVIRRVLRIYGPYLGALTIALIGASRLHSQPLHGAWDLGHWSQPVRAHLVAQHLAFLGIYDWQQYDFVIWSLIQEMRISILFPLLAIVVLRMRSWMALLAGLLLSIVAVRVEQNASPALSPTSFAMMFHYMAFFILGIVLASRLDLLERRLAGSRVIRWAALLLAILCYFKNHWIAFVFVSAWKALFQRQLPDYAFTPILDWVSVIGAAGWILLSLQMPFLKKLLNSHPCQFLGRISYSLYLVHPLVLLTLARSFQERLPLWGEFLLYIPGAILSAWLFCIAIEEPFIAIGRSLGRRSAQRRSSGKLGRAGAVQG